VNRIRFLVVALAALFGLIVVPVSPASANNGLHPSAPGDVQAGAGPGQVGSVFSSRSATTAAVITCTPNVQNPHKSTHVPGTVNVVVTIACTSPVSELHVNAALYRNGALVAQSGYRVFYGTAFGSNNAAEPCHTATYTGWGGFGVLFPPGYVPQWATTSGFGNSVFITC
jgi:hypothetical protein